MSSTMTDSEKAYRRECRHRNEYYRYGKATPAGPWDDDLDNYQEPRYEEEVDGGYKVILRRSQWLSWNGYVKLPSDHPCYNVSHYEFFNRLPEGVPKPPMELSYGSHKEPGVFGFDHTWQGRDFMPRWPFAQAPGHTFSTYEMVREECIKLMKYFHDLKNYDLKNHAPPMNYCEQCCEFCTKLTKVVEGKMCCAACESEVRKEAVDARIAAADARKMPYERERERAAVRASEAVAANKGDAANAGAIYAAMMAKKKGKGKGKGKGKK